MSILFLNILTLLVRTQSADNLFHSFTVLCENENFLISSLHCFFANVTPCPLVLLSSLTEKIHSDATDSVIEDKCIHLLFFAFIHCTDVTESMVV